MMVSNKSVKLKSEGVKNVTFARRSAKIGGGKENPRNEIGNGRESGDLREIRERK